MSELSFLPLLWNNLPRPPKFCNNWSLCWSYFTERSKIMFNNDLWKTKYLLWVFVYSKKRENYAFLQKKQNVCHQKPQWDVSIKSDEEQISLPINLNLFFPVFSLELYNVASSRRSVFIFLRAVFCAAPWLTERLEEAIYNENIFILMNFASLTFPLPRLTQS